MVADLEFLPFLVRVYFAYQFAERLNSTRLGTGSPWRERINYSLRPRTSYYRPGAALQCGKADDRLPKAMVRRVYGRRKQAKKGYQVMSVLLKVLKNTNAHI